VSDLPDFFQIPHLEIQLEDVMTIGAEQKLRIVPASGKGRCCGANSTLVLDDCHDYLFEAISTFPVACS
jgi:hypothetical protein